MLWLGGLLNACLCKDVVGLVLCLLLLGSAIGHLALVKKIPEVLLFRSLQIFLA